MSLGSGASGEAGPLDRVASIKVKLGVLVVASVVAATLLATAGTVAGVPAWLLLPVTVGAALGVTQLLAVGMTAPLRQMTEVARRMANGDLAGRVRADSRDEVGELARAFNTMAADLAAVDQERRSMVATVSHELRTPLTAMCLTLENLADGVVSPDRGELEAALTQAQRLAHLVEDLLDLSRLDAGAQPLAPDEVAVHALLTDAVAEASLGERRVRFEVTVEPADLRVHADPARLRQVVANLLDNASRHSPTDAVVRIRASATEDDWRLEVADQGDGVPEELREAAFDRFGTLAGVGPGAGGGTGLGLAIARWIAELHGGRIGFVDPEPGSRGARVRMQLPRRPVPTVTMRDDVPASSQRPPRRRAEVESSTSEIGLGRIWPDRSTPMGRWLLPAAVATGILAAGVLVPARDPGLGWVLVLLAAGVTAFATARSRDAFTVSCAALCGLLALPVLLRDAAWIGVLCVLAAMVVFVVGATGARTVPQVMLAALAWPLAGLRGMPWVGRTLRRAAGGRVLALIRTVCWSAAALITFGLLFGSADALFAHWVSGLLPDWQVDVGVARGFVGMAVAAMVLAGGYLTMNPPRLEELPTASPRPVANRLEWLIPVLGINLVFAVFLAAQAAVLFGGHDYLRRTTGLSYADYVHQGFGQLTVATALTLIVVAAAGRKAARRTRADRIWHHTALGLLCVLTLIVVASALYRMHLYQQAYGFTRLRVLVDVFEGWLGFLVLVVMVAGVLGRTRWVPRVAVISGAVALLGLAAINPDAWVARQNLDRYAETGKVDWDYLRGLSDDAVPVISELPEHLYGCALPWRHLADPGPDQGPDRGPDGGWTAWNLGRARADAVLRETGPWAVPRECPGQHSTGPVATTG